MNAAARTPAALTWLVLVAATSLSWWLGTDHGITNARGAATVLIVVAFVKVFLIGMQFMELRHADHRLRNAFAAYTVLVCGGLIAMLLSL